MNLKKHIGKTIRKHRIMKGLSQEKLAELSGLSTSYISLIETGQKELSLSKLENLTEILDFCILLTSKQNKIYKNKLSILFSQLSPKEQIFFYKLIIGIKSEFRIK